MIVHNTKEGETKTDTDLLKLIEETFKIEDDTKKSTEIVKIITEDYKAWNHLKENITKDQLYLTETAIENNPKSYQAWYHRLYLFRADPVLLLEKIEREKKLLKLLLNFYNRNFHCWNYKHLLIDILRFLINVEGEVSEKRLKKMKRSGTKIYPSTPGERVVPHEETIKIVYDHLLDLTLIGKDVTNYSYLHFYGDFDACAVVFMDPFEESVWLLYNKKMEDFLMKDGFYVRKYSNRLEIHFKELFYGELNIQMDSITIKHCIELPTKIFQMPFNAFDWSKDSLKVNNKVLSTPSEVFSVSLTNMHSFSHYLEENVFLSNSLYNEIVELEPDCVMNLLFNINKIKDKQFVIERLKELDPLRITYYNSIEIDLYSLFIY